MLWYQTRRAIGYPDAQDCLSVKQKPIREQPGRASYPERGKQGELRIYQDSDRNPTIVKMYPPKDPAYMDPRDDEMKPSQYPGVLFIIRL